MKKLILFIVTIAFLATACSSGGSGNADAVDKAEAMNEENFEKPQKIDDANFVTSFVNQSMYITNLTNAYLATAEPEGNLQKATSTMLEDHAKMMDLARGLAGKYKVTIPAEMGLANKAEIDGFVKNTAQEASMKGEYLDKINGAYATMIENAKSIMDESNNGQMQGFAKKVIEQAESHLDMLKPEMEKLSSIK